MRFVIITGMSGGGKRTALKMLEDEGFYCVDNLPIDLLDKFVEIISNPGNGHKNVALGLDVRSSQIFDDVQEALHKLKEEGNHFEVLFMDSDDATLIRRYKESRRMHPLSPEGRVEDGIIKERKVLKTTREKADYVIDTSNLLTRDLKKELNRIFIQNKEYNGLMVNIVSFGFKNGIPRDADLVFDVRFLPNPYYIEDLKNKTGNDVEVQEYVKSFPETKEFLEKLTDMVLFLIPNYVKEGKHQLIIGIGCTGGQHRSVTLANELYRCLLDKGSYGLKITHRDVKRGV